MIKGTVMLVEDSEDDMALMDHAIKVAGVDNPMIELRNGVEAIEYLSGSGEYGNRQRHPIPCLVITDLSMPKMDGFDLLKWMAGQPELKSIPRIVVSSSTLQQDRERAVDLGACAYFQKPLEIKELIELVRHLDANWIAQHCHKPN